MLRPRRVTHQNPHESLTGVGRNRFPMWEMALSVVTVPLIPSSFYCSIRNAGSTPSRAFAPMFDV